MKNLSLLLSCLFVLSLLACRSTPQLREEAYMALPTLPSVRYTQSDVQKLHWLAGAWQGTEAGRSVRKLFQFHDNSTLEILDFDSQYGSTSSLLTWHEGRYYVGSNRQWVIAWIGEKDVRLDPAVAGVEAMTWTRLNDNQWHLVRHTAEGDETLLLERRENMQP